MENLIFKVVNINSGTRGDVLAYDSNGKLTKVSLGSAGQILKSDGTDVVFGDLGGATNVYYVSKNGVDAAGRGSSIDSAWASIKYACSNLPVTPTKAAPAVIFVKSGTYLKKHNFQSLFLNIQQSLVITFVLLQ